MANYRQYTYKIKEDFSASSVHYAGTGMPTTSHNFRKNDIEHGGPIYPENYNPSDPFWLLATPLITQVELVVNGIQYHVPISRVQQISAGGLTNSKPVLTNKQKLITALIIGAIAYLFFKK